MTTNGPDFLGIGAQRSGTSWLQANIGAHPQIWSTPVKELHYFDVFRPVAENRELFWTQYRRHLRTRLYRSAGELLRLDYAPRGLAWDARYFLRRRTDAWYRSLFRPAKGRVAGEFTPAYAVLPDGTVGEIARMFPRLKVIYIMRDPISRSWSNVANRFNRLRLTFDDTTPEELIGLMSGGGMLQRSDYPTTISNWERHFPREQIFYGFFDEIREQPKDLLLRLFEFLGVEGAAAHLPPGFERPRNSKPLSRVKMPREIEAALARLHLANLEWLTERFGAYPARWLERARNALAA